jgi:hypothetical protein
MQLTCEVTVIFQLPIDTQPNSHSLGQWIDVDIRCLAQRCGLQNFFAHLDRIFVPVATTGRDAHRAGSRDLSAERIANGGFQ